VYVSPHEVNNETGTLKRNLDNLLMGLLIYVFTTENINERLNIFCLTKQSQYLLEKVWANNTLLL